MNGMKFIMNGMIIPYEWNDFQITDVKITLIYKQYKISINLIKCILQ